MPSFFVLYAAQNTDFNLMKLLQTLSVFLFAGWLSQSNGQIYAQTQTGLGTYYADKYHGRPTASGELYDKYKFSAAHRTLGFGTMVRVTRLDNGRSVVVKVNDRGPFSEGRIIDVSRVAAEQLDMIRDGEVQVRIEVVPGASAGSSTSSQAQSPGGRPPAQRPQYNPDNRDLSSLPLRNFGGQPVNSAGQVEAQPSTTVGSPAQPGASAMKGATAYTPAFFQFVAFKRDVDGFVVQVGAFFNYYKLMEAMDGLSQKGIQNTILHSSLKNGEPVFRILIGSYPSREEAKSVLRTLTSQGVEGIVVKVSDLR